jgi:hypothetical protein
MGGKKKKKKKKKMNNTPIKKGNGTEEKDTPYSITINVEKNTNKGTIMGPGLVTTEMAK